MSRVVRCKKYVKSELLGPAQIAHCQMFGTLLCWGRLWCCHLRWEFGLYLKVPNSTSPSLQSNQNYRRKYPSGKPSCQSTIITLSFGFFCKELKMPGNSRSMSLAVTSEVSLPLISLWMILDTEAGQLQRRSSTTTSSSALKRLKFFLHWWFEIFNRSIPAEQIHKI